MRRELLAARLRTVADTWFVFVVTLLVATSLLGGFLAYSAYAEGPETDTEERTVEAWSTTAGFDHGAEVQRENAVFEVGEELSNEPVYFTRAAPELDGEFEHRYDGGEGAVDVEITVERVIRSVDDDVEHWATSEPVGSVEREDVEPGEGVVADFEVDVPALENETERVEDSLGQTPGTVETVVVAHVILEGTIDGDPVTHGDRYELAIDPDGDAYAVEAPVADRHVEERTEEVEAAATASVFGPAPGAALALVSVAVLSALVRSRSQGTLAPSRTELERLRLDRERAAFDDWISTGAVPADVDDRTRVEIDSLEDLVDVAIDHDRRVIESQDGRYYVVEEGLLYVHERERAVGGGPVEPGGSPNDGDEPTGSETVTDDGDEPTGGETVSDDGER